MKVVHEYLVVTLLIFQQVYKLYLICIVTPLEIEGLIPV